jgi:membrane protease YdiL (CAAX protease family)
MGQETQMQVELSWRHILPGLGYIAAIDILAVTGWLTSITWLQRYWMAPVIILPWLLAALAPERMKLMGYHRREWLASFGWGVVAGGFWRIASLIFNLALATSGGNLLGWGEIISTAAIVPFIEETFFRGYLGRGLVTKLGFWPGILIQSLLFAFHPIHWAQGWIHLVSIFGFGVIAGWLVERRGSIWAPWGAHAFANLIPIAMRALV